MYLLDHMDKIYIKDMAMVDLTFSQKFQVNALSIYSFFLKITELKYRIAWTSLTRPKKSVDFRFFCNI